MNAYSSGVSFGPLCSVLQTIMTVNRRRRRRSREYFIPAGNDRSCLMIRTGSMEGLGKKILVGVALPCIRIGFPYGYHHTVVLFKAFSDHGPGGNCPRYVP